MHITVHAGQRMNHRGITKEMIEIVLEYGETQDKKTTLSRDAAVRLVAELQRQAEERQREVSKIQHQMKFAKKLLDKGGVTVVPDECVILDETVIITTYNCAPQNRSKKWQGKSEQSRTRNKTEQAFGSQKRKGHGQ